MAEKASPYVSHLGIVLGLQQSSSHAALAAAASKGLGLFPKLKMRA
jgi:hypothetical protein